ncbi:MAG: DUF721 domain-containing protein [Verrucomicrobia bacterium]|nr:DUF721 domain-containing protein [Verrucomicrobiota bacterium]
MKSKNNRLDEWRLTRERFHISSPFPPPFRRRPGRMIGAILSELRGQEVPSDTLPEILQARWAVIAGEQIAQHTHPSHLRGSQLYVYADHPGWLSEIRRLPTEHLLKKIASIPGAPEIKEIRFQLDPSIRTYRK